MPQQSVLKVTSSSAMTGRRLEHAQPPHAPSIKARVQCVQKPENMAHVDPQHEHISTLQTSRATDGASDATGASGSFAHVAVEAVPGQRPPSLSRLQPVNAAPDTAVTPTTKHKAAPPARANKEAIKTLMRTQPAHTDTPNPQYAPATPHGSAGSHAHEDAAACTTSTGAVAPLGRGRRARKLTTKLVAAGADGIAALSRAPPRHAVSPRARATKRSREDSREDKASSEAAAGSSMTVAFVRAPSPTPAATFADAASTATTRGKRSRKGTPARASE